MDTLLLFSFLSVALILLRWLKFASSRSLPLPPGPKSLPIIGSLFHAPVSMPWRTFREWSHTYGDVIYMTIPRQQTIILGSFQAVSDLLEKRSDIYSDRTHTVMNDLMSFDTWDFPLMKYSPLWRSHRREFHQFFNQHQVPQYRPIQLHQSRTFLRRILEDPSRLNQHICLTPAAIILKIAYDIDVTNPDDEYLQLATDVVEKTTEAQLPGRFWIEFVPFLKHLPAWVPGAEFKRFVEDINPKIEQMLNQPWDGVKRDIASGKVGHSMAATFIGKLQSEKDEDLHEKEITARSVTGLAYATGADTVCSPMQLLS
ncbi:hypothetical protein QCA50_003969 [Cerrena zonata]|uniref:Cytochrome P450 n=1 Tax=Cerrena zonata TaxID=2478898 RepID=A0AAW0GMH6_9APHY